MRLHFAICTSGPDYAGLAPKQASQDDFSIGTDDLLIPCASCPSLSHELSSRPYGAQAAVSPPHGMPSILLYLSDSVGEVKLQQQAWRKG